MKITKQRLQEIILEEMKEASLIELDRGRQPQTTRGRLGMSSEEAGEALAADTPEEDDFSKRAAVQGSKELRGKGTAAVADVAAMTPRDAQIEAMLQALHNELIKKGDVQAATTVARYIKTALKAARAAE